MCAFRIHATVACISVLFVGVAIPQTARRRTTNYRQWLWNQTPRFPPVNGTGVFEWCRKAECADRRFYSRFYKIEDLEFVNASAATWELHMGLWSAYKLHILLTIIPRHPVDADYYYEIALGQWHPRVNYGKGLCYVFVKDSAEEARSEEFPHLYERPWLLTWKQFRPFLLTITRGGVTQNVSMEGLEGNGGTIVSFHNNRSSLDVKYISFGSVWRSESKIFFDCPNHRYGNVQYIARPLAAPLGRLMLPSCRPELCEHCPDVYFPVCSSEHITYRNECFFQCRKQHQNTTVLHKGLCWHWQWQF